jgi:hypothetical protein
MNKFLSWLYPAFKTLFPNTANTVRQLGKAMIYAAQNGYEKKVVEVSDIKILADREMKR